MSQTSLPSHSGPIVLIAARRPGSSAPTASCSMPTPKSKPSRMKNPIHRTVIAMNQNVTIGASILDSRNGSVRLNLAARRRELLAGVLQHQQEVDDAEHGVQIGRAHV